MNQTLSDKIIKSATKVPESKPLDESVKPAGNVEPGVTVHVIAPVPLIDMNCTL